MRRDNSTSLRRGSEMQTKTDYQVTEVRKGNRVVRITRDGAKVSAAAYVGATEGDESRWVYCRGWSGKTVKGATTWANKWLGQY